MVGKLTAGNWENRHDLDRFAGEDREMRMVLEQLRRGLVRCGADNSKCAHLIADVGDAVCVDLLGLAQRSAHLDDDTLVLLDPRLPRGHALLLPSAPVTFAQC